MKNTAKTMLAFWVGSLFHVCLSQAATIVVDNDGVCTLADAITSANNDATAGGCSAGSGEDTIILQKDVILGAALPQVASTITIDGNGYKIDGQNKILEVGTPLEILNTGDLTINNLLVTNGSSYGGGGVYNEGGILTLNRSTVSGNGARGSGGGLYNYGGIVTLNNATVSGNAARNSGGGIWNSGGTVILSSSTVSNNTSGSAPGDGGGVCNYNGKVVLRSSIVSGNINYGMGTPSGNEIYGSAIIADSHNVLGHSGESNAEAFSDFIPGSKDVTATSDGTKPTALAAILSPLADNGGQTQTHALVADSPAIDLDATCSTGLSTDQRGYCRSVGSGCDAGSFEFGAAISSDTDGDGTPDACDNCPATPNSAQKDSNGDGIGNACEQVKMIPIYNLLLKR